MRQASPLIKKKPIISKASKAKVKATPPIDQKKKPKKYLTNKNLLAQIHLSK